MKILFLNLKNIFQIIKRVIELQMYYYYYIPDLYCAHFMRNTFKCALHCVAATRAQVHPLQVQI